MKKIQRNGKRVLAFVSALILLIIMVPLDGIKVHAEGLMSIENLRWQEGSSATVQWDVADEANYYSVTVNVFENDGMTLIGSTETGTTATELDVQQEIHNVIGEGDYDVVKVVATVCAQKKQDDVVIEQSEGVTTGLWDYILKAKLPTPTNVSLSDDYILSFTCDMDNPEEVIDTIVLQLYINDICEASLYVSNLVWDGNNCTADISENIEWAYKATSHSGEVDVSCYFKLLAKENPFANRDYSEMSNSVKYISDIGKLPTPTNVSLSDDYILTFTCDMEDSEEVIDTILLQLYINDICEASPYVSDLVWDGNNCTADISETIEWAYKATSHSGEVNVSCFFKLLAKENQFANSDYSEMSNSVKYNSDIEKLPTPTNVSLSDDYILTFSCDMENPEEVIDTIVLQLYINDIAEASLYVSNLVWDGNNCTADISENIEWAYKATSHSGEVDVSCFFKLLAKENLFANSDYSEMTNSVKYNSLKDVESISLAPSEPIVCQGNSYYLGKTIAPEDAYYETIDWSSDDEDIVTVDDTGMITGVAPGTANVTAAIDEATDTVPVTVYTISSNIEEDEENQEVIDTAGDIIDDIVNNENPNLDNTDIDEGDLVEIKEDIQEGIANGDTFHTDLVAIQETYDKYKLNWGQVQKATRFLNAQFEGAYNIEVEMYHKDKNGNQTHIGNITELENEVTFTFDLPTGMKEQQSGNTKKYVLVRIHINSYGEEEYTPVNYTINDDGTFTASSNLYSDFVWVSENIEDYSREWAVGYPNADDVIASYYPNKNVLIISGNGKINDNFEHIVSGVSPKTLIIDEGVEYIPGRLNNNVFSASNNLKQAENVVLLGDIPEIYAETFKGWGNLKRVILPDSVKKIGKEAFANCKYLELINMPSSVEEIGEKAFSQTGTMRNQSIIPNTIEIPNTIKRIDRNAFSACCFDVSLPSLNYRIVQPSESNFGDGVLGIESDAFSGIGGCLSLYYPDYEYSNYLGTIFHDVSDIAIYTTENCSEIRLDTLPRVNNKLEIHMLSRHQTIEGNYQYYQNNVNVQIYAPDYLVQYYKDQISRTNLSPNSVVAELNSEYAWTSLNPGIYIDDGTYYSWDEAIRNDLIARQVTSEYRRGGRWINQGLIRIVFPDNESFSIASGGFNYCSNLREIVFPSSDVNYSLGEGAFAGCNNLNKVYNYVPQADFIDKRLFDNDNINFIGFEGESYYLFDKVLIKSNNVQHENGNKCGLNANWTFDNGTLIISGTGEVSSASWEVAINKDAINTIVVEEGITSFQASLWSYSNLSKLYYPSTLTFIRDDALGWCTSLISAGPTGSGASIEYAWTTTIPENAFYGAYKLSSVTFPEGVEVIGERAFANCTDIETIVIPNTVKEIKAYAFDMTLSAYYPSVMTEISIPSSVESIGENAFNGCENMTKITIENSDCLIFDSPDTIPRNATIYGRDISTANEYARKYDRTFVSLDEHNFDQQVKDDKYLKSFTVCGEEAEYYYSCICGECSSSDTFTAILDHKWDDGVVTKAATEEEEGIRTFTCQREGCNATCTEAIPKIFVDHTCGLYANWTFNNGTLTISGYGEVSSLNWESTINRSDVQTIVIEEGITSFKVYLQSYDNLSKLYYPSTLTSINYIPFVSCPKLVSAGPIGSGSSIEFAWTTIIPDNAFNGAYKLASITFPEGVEVIGERAFANCNDLESIEIPNTVKEIKRQAFDMKLFANYPSLLTEISIPSSVESIGENAFVNCDALTKITIENPECSIYNSANTIPSGATIYGKSESTAKEYAQRYDRTFIEIVEPIIITVNSCDKIGNVVPVNLTGTDEYSLGEEVSFYAPKVDGYNFMGWYLASDIAPYYTGSAFCTTNNYNFINTYENNTDIVAVYEPLGSVSITFNCNGIYSINGKRKGSEVTASYPLGSQITLSTDAQDFAYWKNGFGKILSRSRSYTFTVTNTDTITGVTNIVLEDQATLIFESLYDQVIARNQLELGDTMIIPNVPHRNGYNPLGWDMNGDGAFNVETDTFDAAIQRGLQAEDQVVVIYPVYELKENSYTVSVIGGTGSGVYRQNTLVRVSLDDTVIPEGKKFSHWEDADSEIRGYAQTLEFYAERDEVITAIYVDEEEVIEEKGTTTLVAIEKDFVNKTMSFSSMSTVPEGYSIVTAGVIATSDASIGLSGDDFNANTATYVRGRSYDGTGYRYTWTKSNVNEGDTWYVRAYLVYSDADGNLYTVYGDMVSETY